MKLFSFQAELWLPRNRSEVFEFFSNPNNLGQIAPPWVRFHLISSSPEEMRAGTELQYRLKIHGIPISWRSRITAWDPPNRFVDEQIQGPYRRWIHEHRFVEAHGGASYEDCLQYAPLGGALINALFVRRDIEKIFAYRSQRLQAIFGSEPGG